MSPCSPLQTKLLMSLSAAPRMMEAEDIILTDCAIGEMSTLQRMASKCVWRVSPGRHLSYTLRHNDEVIGLIFLSSPVMNMKRRDRFLGMPTDCRQKGLELKHYMDLSVCVGIQPLAWHWNLGKLCALIAPTLGPQYKERYGDTLKGIITTSYFGMSSQYNRIYKFIGMSSGHGSMHVDDYEFARMKAHLKHHGIPIGNWKHTRMAVIQAYRRSMGGAVASEIKRSTTHGQRRAIYYHAAVEHDWREAVRLWYARWGLPRWERTKSERAPYADGLS